jgi:acetyl esterase/lipase
MTISQLKTLGIRLEVGLGIGLVLACLGALLWAKERDPFERRWFTLRVPGHSDVACVSVVPKTAARPMPVAVYLHGGSGEILNDGTELRQLAEPGLAAVSMQYCKTNEARAAAEMAALLHYISRQSWAATNEMVWVGLSRGAKQGTQLWIRDAGARPSLLVRLSGGWLPEMEEFEPKTDAPITNNIPAADPQAKPDVLIIHGDGDTLFPTVDAKRMARALQAAGAAVQLRVLPNEDHALTLNRRLVFRALGEYCLIRLRGAEALNQHQSIGVWRLKACPAWIYFTPAGGWICGWLLWRRKCRVPSTASRARVRTHSERLCRWAAGGIGVSALALSAAHLVTPRLEVSAGTLALARTLLVAPHTRSDFERLCELPGMKGQKLQALLDHARLARYNRTLVAWELKDEVYREFVLSPLIDNGADADLRWRRVLWESLYPRVRRETAMNVAAETVVRHLRERVTISRSDALPSRNMTEMWRRQVTNRSGFARLAVAGLRSVGIPARLNAHGEAEMLVEGAWRPTPQPIIEQW